ncbi:hypothetical protein RRG08_024269 [Elysia crispata]|uniref:Uncharacterized protein n=1 Tax=Elysia crispata TaxID=231223 RepID=A0AAE1D8Q1_9GAST|nr:hypothetical protein RRG08_024269 [Elysia crispata]
MNTPSHYKSWLALVFGSCFSQAGGVGLERKTISPRYMRRHGRSWRTPPNPVKVSASRHPSPQRPGSDFFNLSNRVRSILGRRLDPPSGLRTQWTFSAVHPAPIQPSGSGHGLNLSKASSPAFLQRPFSESLKIRRKMEKLANMNLTIRVGEMEIR